MLCGQSAAVFVALLTRATLEIVERRPRIRLYYNGAVFALAAGAAGLAMTPFDLNDHAAKLLFEVLAGATAFYARRRAADRRDPRALVAGAVPAAAALGRVHDRGDVRDHGLRQPGARRALDAVAGARARARRPARRRRAAPALDAQRAAGDAARADRPAHGPRQPPALPGAAADPARGGRRRRAKPLTVCLFDLDDFKQINDRYGHPVGDRVLAHVASRLRDDPARPTGSAATSSPSCSRATRADAAAAACRASSCAPSARRTGSRADTLRVSAGIATYPDHSQRPQRARARRRHRALLGEGRGQEPGLRLPAGHARGHAAAAAHAGAGPGGEAPGRRGARERRRRARRIRGQSLDPGRRSRRRGRGASAACPRRRSS